MAAINSRDRFARPRPFFNSEKNTSSSPAAAALVLRPREGFFDPGRKYSAIAAFLAVSQVRYVMVIPEPTSDCTYERPREGAFRLGGGGFLFFAAAAPRRRISARRAARGGKLAAQIGANGFDCYEPDVSIQE